MRDAATAVPFLTTFSKGSSLQKTSLCRAVGTQGSTIGGKPRQGVLAKSTLGPSDASHPQGQVHRAKPHVG